MQLHRFGAIQPFWYNVQVFLRQHLAEHDLLLGIIYGLLREPDCYPDNLYLAIVWK